jgi:hypothetical protein
MREETNLIKSSEDINNIFNRAYNSLSNHTAFYIDIQYREALVDVLGIPPEDTIKYLSLPKRGPKEAAIVTLCKWVLNGSPLPKGWDQPKMNTFLSLIEKELQKDKIDRYSNLIRSITEEK